MMKLIGIATRVGALASVKMLRGGAIVALLAVLLGVTAVSSVSSSPVISATKTDVLVVDNNANNDADPGDTLRYTITVEQSGTTAAAGVTFSDTLDPNTTLVAGSLRTTPIARNDSYTSLGNVGITVPPANGVLANDNDPDGQSVSVIAAAGGTANGGAFAIGADGSFSYQSPPGFEGADSFTYTVQDSDGNQDPATVFVTVNEVIWFIDNSLGSAGSGVLSSPFNSLSTFNSSAADEAGDIIFLYSGSGSYSGGITLLNNQILIGQGASAAIAAIAGITVPPYSNALPTTGGPRPIITSSGDGVTLGQNNLLRGFNVGSTAGRAIRDSGGTVGNLTISETAVSGPGRGVELDNGGTLAVTLDRVAASGGTNGISLGNTGGSFAVTGTGTANSGGTLSGHAAEGVRLNNATDVSLTDMVINQSATNGTQGIDATGVTGLTLVRTTITAGSGSSYALLGSNIRNMTATGSIFDGGGGSVANIDGTRITNLLGSNTFTNSTFRNGKDINLLIENDSNGGGLDTLTISGSGFSNSAGGDHLQVEADGTANLKLVINASGAGNTTFSGTGQDGMQLEAQGNATLQAVVTQATISGNLGSAVNLAAVGNGHLIARVHNLSNLTSGGTNVINMINFDTSLIEATVENNSINMNGTAFNGVRVIQEGNGTMTARIANNTITGVAQERGILVQGRAGTGGNGRLNATLNNNTVNVSGALSLDAIEVTAGSSAGGDTNTICLNMFSNNSTSANYDGYFLRQRTGSTFQLQDFAGGTAANWVTNTKSNVGSVFTSGTFVNAPAPCATPTVPVAAVASGLAVAAAAPETPSLQMAAPAVPSETKVRAVGRRSAVPALSGETINVALGALDPGQSVTITFDVTVDSPQNPVTNRQVCNQGAVSGNNLANVSTDDPDVGGPADPTCTTLAPGTIIIAKDQSPDGSDSFGFSSDIPGNATFSVSGDSSVTLNNLTPGSYTVTEDDPAPGSFALVGLNCDDGGSAAPSTTDLGARTATVNLEAGETVTCTFTNEQSGRIEVIKSVDATPNGETFDLLIDGNVVAAGVGDGGSTGKTAVSVGNHSVGETGANLSNYNTAIACVLDGTNTVVASGSGTSLADVPVNAGDDVICTITNTHKTGSLELQLVVEPAGGVFDLFIDGNVVATGGSGVTTGEQTVLIGDHTVNIDGSGGTNAADYFTNLTCRDGNGAGAIVAQGDVVGAASIDVPVAEGDDVVCVATARLMATIYVAIVANPADDTLFSFSHDINGGGTFTLQDPSDSSRPFGGVMPGNYTVSEGALPPGWSLTAVTCSEDGQANSGGDVAGAQASIGADPGETVTCTFTHVFNRPPDCTTAVADQTGLWPPNHKFVPINVLGVTDPDGDAVTVTIDTIFQDEAVDAPGSGNTAPDGRGVGTATAEVRAERVGDGNGRVYHIGFTADDGQGATCSGVVQVGVPVSKKATAVDDGSLFDSTVMP